MCKLNSKLPKDHSNRACVNFGKVQNKLDNQVLTANRLSTQFASAGNRLLWQMPLLCVLQRDSRLASGSQLHEDTDMDLTGSSPDLWLESDDMITHGHGILASVAFIPPTTGSSPNHTKDLLGHTPLDSRLDIYRRTSFAIQRMLQLISETELDFNEADDSAQCEFPLRFTWCHGFPASHIAYLNGDRSAALNLWREIHPPHQEVDVAGRTLIHIAVAARDVGFVNQLLEQDSSYVATTSFDALEQTPLKIAALLDEHHIFCDLLMANQELTIDKEILKLVVISGSMAVLNFSLRYEYIPAPLGPYVRDALEHNQFEVAAKLEPYIYGAETYDKDEIEELAAIAQSKDQDGLGTRLRQSSPVNATVSQGFDALRRIGSQLRRTRATGMDPSSATPSVLAQSPTSAEWNEDFNMTFANMQSNMPTQYPVSGAQAPFESSQRNWE